MRVFTEKNIEDYMDYVDKYVIELDEVLGRCFQCGKDLNEVVLPEGAEKKVVCLDHKEDFVNAFEELFEMGEFKE